MQAATAAGPSCYQTCKGRPPSGLLGAAPHPRTGPAPELWAARERRLKEFAEIGREPESEALLRLSDLGIGETGIKLDPVNRSGRGDDPKLVLGSAEVVDEVLPVAAVYNGSPSPPRHHQPRTEAD